MADNASANREHGPAPFEFVENMVRGLPSVPDADGHIRTYLGLSPEEAREGCEKEATVLHPCKECDSVVCSECAGSTVLHSKTFGPAKLEATCTTCVGGRVYPQECPNCKGTGSKAVTHRLRVPPRTAFGTTLRIAGAGDKPDGKPAGDVLFVVTSQVLVSELLKPLLGKFLALTLALAVVVAYLLR